MNKNSTSYDTIIALSTPRGQGALALIRMSGKDAMTILDLCAKNKRGISFSEIPSHTVHFATLYDPQGNVIDHPLITILKGPATFTGEDTVEISVHNNPFIIDATINAALAHGARLANPGEFTQRAVLLGKIDLIQAEAIHEVIHAQTQDALRHALDQMEGSLSWHIKTIEQQIMHILGLSNASFEFVEEENYAFASSIAKLARNIITEIETLQKNFDRQAIIRQGVRVALIGSVNAGKSSLFNKLVGKDRAIVSAQAGTTRDVIEAGMYEYGTYITFIDTAGLRSTGDNIEQEGIRRSFSQAESADIILLVYDAQHKQSVQEQVIYQELHKKYGQKIICLANKSDTDIDITLNSESIPTSTFHPNGITQLTKKLELKIKELFSSHATPFLINLRHNHALSSIKEQLIKIEELANVLHTPYELISFHCMQALGECTQLTGRSISEAAMDHVFKNFCVGK